MYTFVSINKIIECSDNPFGRNLFDNVKTLHSNMIHVNSILELFSSPISEAL